jgi:hypothetical protein
MVQSQFINQMIQFNKAAFDNSFKAMEMLRKQNEKTANSLLDQATWMPAEGKKAINEWMNVYKKGCDDFKRTVDLNFKNVEDFFSGFAK